MGERWHASIAKTQDALQLRETELSPEIEQRRARRRAGAISTMAGGAVFLVNGRAPLDLRGIRNSRMIAGTGGTATRLFRKRTTPG
jgi:hypothetical protein